MTNNLSSALADSEHYTGPGGQYEAIDSTHVWVGIWLALTSVSDAKQCCVPGFRFQHSDFLDLSEGETDYC